MAMHAHICAAMPEAGRYKIRCSTPSGLLEAHGATGRDATKDKGEYDRKVVVPVKLTACHLLSPMTRKWCMVCDTGESRVI